MTKKTFIVSISAVFVWSFLMIFIPHFAENKSKSIKTDVTVTTVVDENESILLSLEPVLRAREGLMLKPYMLDSVWYIYYGHLMLPNESFKNPDTAKADSTLKSDIYKAYMEVERINNARLYRDIYDVFISGKILH